MSVAVATLGTTLRRGAQTIVTGGVAAEATDLVTKATHGLTAGDVVRFTTLTGGAGLSLSSLYWVIADGLTTDVFKVSTTSGGSAVDITTDYTDVSFVSPGAAIAQVQDVTGPQLSTDEDEITNHDSPGGVEEFIMTIKRTGELTFPCVFIPTNATHDGTTGILKAWSDKSLDDFELRFPDGSGWDFSGYVKGISMSAPVGGHLAADVTIRPSGEPTYVDGS